jgi:tungstate transport system ATP-binding protein
MNKGTILPLSLKQLSFRIDGKTLIKNLSHSFEPGTKTIILGPNGAGKSLLLRLCHGLLKPTEGSVDWHGNPAHKQAMVFQRPVMLRRSVAANVTYALKLKGLNREYRNVRTSKVLERTGLTHLTHTPACVLSFGEQQKLALARAWALNPQVLFLDEPSASLDPAATDAIEDIIEAIHCSGTRIIMATHNLAQAKRLADDILFIHRGEILESSAAFSFFSGPQSPQALAFLEGQLLWQTTSET